jgi:hypothetical protein
MSPQRGATQTEGFAYESIGSHINIFFIPFLKELVLQVEVVVMIILEYHLSATLLLCQWCFWEFEGKGICTNECYLFEIFTAFEDHAI